MTNKEVTEPISMATTKEASVILESLKALEISIPVFKEQVLRHNYGIAMITGVLTLARAEQLIATIDFCKSDHIIGMSAIEQMQKLKAE